jgi:hypothetical protein
MLKVSGGNIYRILSRFFRKINAPYRLTVINEETMSEALTVHLTKKSIYIYLSSGFVLIFLLLSSLFLFTPLRYYIPGANTNVSRTKLIQLQKLSDSLTTLNSIREKYIYNLINIANGNLTALVDSTSLTAKQIELAKQQNLNKIDHASKYDYLKTIKKDSANLVEEVQKDTSQKRENFKEKN